MVYINQYWLNKRNDYYYQFWNVKKQFTVGKIGNII